MDALRGPFHCAMLFLLKKRWTTACLGLAVLGLTGLLLRRFFDGAPLSISSYALLLGLGVVGIVLASDILVHGLLCVCWGNSYRRKHQALASEFRDQKASAIITGALMAGIGEELVFRGVSLSPLYLYSAAILFGGLHHIRRELWPFTVWAIWQGALFATALHFTQMLTVTMVAHFLHDFLGFLIFRYLNHTSTRSPSYGINARIE